MSDNEVPATPVRRTAAKRIRVPDDEWEDHAQSDDSVDGSSVGRSSTSRITSPGIKVRTSKATRAGSDVIGSAKRAPVRRRKVQSAVAQSPAAGGRPGAAGSSTPKREIPDKVRRTAIPAVSVRPAPQGSSVRSNLGLAASVTFSILQRITLFGVSILSTLLAPYILPIALTLTTTVFLGLSVYFLLPLLPSFLVNLTAKALRTILPGTTWAVGSLSNLGITRSAAIVPARVIVTPACTLLGLGCQYSLLSTFRPDERIELEVGDEAYGAGDLRIARPFWEWDWSAVVPNLKAGGKGRGGVDVGSIARGLGKEVKQARDIFESVQSMSSAGLIRNLHYVK
jgi:hypothetical protein